MEMVTDMPTYHIVLRYTWSAESDDYQHFHVASADVGEFLLDKCNSGYLVSLFTSSQK